MIRVERPKDSVPSVLTTKGKKETNKAIKQYRDKLAMHFFSKPYKELSDGEKDKVIHFAPQLLPIESPSTSESSSQPLEKKNYKFDVYRDREIKEALRKLFHGKCAYCESSYAGTQPMDVEHWRPKGGFVDESDPKKEELVWPGYFWLAADWNNLLPSCIDCNRRRNQIVWSKEEPLRMGKESQFPVVDEAKRWRDPDQYSPGQIIEEEPLLLNPCTDKEEDWPEKHLTFDENAVLVPKPDPKDKSRPSPKAEASIRVYALNRTDLVLSRQERLRLLEYHKHTITKLIDLLVSLEKKCVEASSDAYQDMLAIVDELLCYEFAALEGFKKPNEPYVLLARTFIEAFENELKPELISSYRKQAETV
jgi:uncharacterized protein (TIGR02646 family)